MALIITAIITFIIVMALFIYVMQNHMLVIYKVRGSFEEVKEALTKAVPEVPGWSFPMEGLPLTDSLKKKGCQFKDIKNGMIYFVCNPDQACLMLNTNYSFSGMMPCSWAVIEKQDGSVEIIKMNITLMSNMYFGKTKEIMKKVAVAEEQMLANLKRHLGM